MYTPALVRVRYPAVRIPPVVVSTTRGNETGGVALNASPSRDRSSAGSTATASARTRVPTCGCLIRARLRPSVATPAAVSTITPIGAEANTAAIATTAHTRTWIRASNASGLTRVRTQRMPKNTPTPMSTPTHRAIGTAAPTPRATPRPISAESTMMLKPAMILTAKSPSGAVSSGFGCSAGSACARRSWPAATIAAEPCTTPSGHPSERLATARARWALTVAWRHCRRRRSTAAFGAAAAFPTPPFRTMSCQSWPWTSHRRRELKYAIAQATANTPAISSVDTRPTPNSCRVPSAATPADAGSRAADSRTSSTIHPTTKT